jgi:hypothetical protein
LTIAFVLIMWDHDINSFDEELFIIGGWSAETGRKQDEALGTRPAHQ